MKDKATKPFEFVHELEDKPTVPLENQVDEAKKLDAGKLRMDLLPPEILIGIAEVLTFGVTKYGDRNWERGMSWGSVFAALMRHMWAWWNPLESDKDKETGLSHLYHAASCIAFLISYEVRRIGTDDRSK